VPRSGGYLTSPLMLSRKTGLGRRPKEVIGGQNLKILLAKALRRVCRALDTFSGLNRRGTVIESRPWNIVRHLIYNQTSNFDNSFFALRRLMVCVGLSVTASDGMNVMFSPH
jgi:hypothetical protein